MIRAIFVVFALTGVWASTTAPELVPTSEFDCNGKAHDRYYSSSTDCTVYYRCPEAESGALKYECPTGNVFYEPNQGCDWDYNVPPPCGTSTSTPAYSTQPGDTVPPEDNPFFCTGLAPGSYPDPDCCNKFYICDSKADNSIAVTPQYCPDGLAFNPAVGYCDYPSNVPGCETLQCVD